MTKFDDFIKFSPDPDIAEKRITRLLDNKVISKFLDKLSDENQKVFINLVTISNFLFHFIAREPELALKSINNSNNTFEQIKKINNIQELRLFKYQNLLNIAWHDIANTSSYNKVLFDLSQLADQIIKKVLQINFIEQVPDANVRGQSPLCIFAMGKLGAIELNFSSDIDLVFICADKDEINYSYDEYISILTGLIRKFSRTLAENTEHGFFYRVDLNIRPLGRSGPLTLSVDATENYYAASTEAWERFAWLRARQIVDKDGLGSELLQRLHPFIYLRKLSNDDLDRFLTIKNDMAKIRKKSDSWNVKLGEGGIRDIEFFIQILQITNAFKNPSLQTTNTLSILDGLIKSGLIETDLGNDIRNSYLFLRKLENRLQMIDELQTHELPNDNDKRIRIARSFGHSDEDNNKNLEIFNEQLDIHRRIAKQCFEQILPGR